MNILWEDEAWEEYLEWQKDKAILKRINLIIKDMKKESVWTEFGKPEPLKENYSGWWSRRITDEHRIVYKVTSEYIVIASCKTHYKS